MTEKRFYVAKSNLIDGYCVFDKEKKYAFSPKPRKADCLNDAHILNELHEENRELQRHLDVMRSGALTDDKRIKELYNENEQLKNWKYNCSSFINENSILWNEIAIMREQGAKPSSAFEEYCSKFKGDDGND